MGLPYAWQAPATAYSRCQSLPEYESATHRFFCSCFCLLNAYGLVVNKGFIASARLYPTKQYTLALP